MSFIRPLVILVFIAIVSCNNNHSNTLSAITQDTQAAPAPLHIYSTAFKEGDTIPALYTCDSSNISPPLHWNNPFKNTASFALIVDDPDAPMTTWVHWVVYNIPANDTILMTDIAHVSNLASDTDIINGAKQGITSIGKPGYDGPCSPNGTHHYHFKLYALSTLLQFPAGLSKNKLLAAMKGHILGEADLVGLYKERKKLN
ncbi:MAG TPA: YbhB/YbcL family Raf kinase inhibitor-like protein [Bacteroidia bacterium]|jgi:Raf kinase inhibitor-like YbhB/YbcL family protein|nr:YbhB/YbcL family Raf kinase inhibitor-like protein [Bacteroidia bacterium]